MNEETIKMLNIINDKIKKCKKDNNVNTLLAIPLGSYGEFGYLTDKMLNEIIVIQQENARLKDKNEKVEEWLKYKAEALDTFDIPKRKETGAFWFTTRGEIDGLLELLKEN